MTVWIGPNKIGTIEKLDASHRYEFTNTQSDKCVELKSGTAGINGAEVEVFGTLGM
jgi:hypothetical protein